MSNTLESVLVLRYVPFLFWYLSLPWGNACIKYMHLTGRSHVAHKACSIMFSSFFSSFFLVLSHLDGNDTINHDNTLCLIIMIIIVVLKKILLGRPIVKTEQGWPVTDCLSRLKVTTWQEIRLPHWLLLSETKHMSSLHTHCLFLTQINSLCVLFIFCGTFFFLFSKLLFF